MTMNSCVTDIYYILSITILIQRGKIRLGIKLVNICIIHLEIFILKATNTNNAIQMFGIGQNIDSFVFDDLQ